MLTAENSVTGCGSENLYHVTRQTVPLGTRERTREMRQSAMLKQMCGSVLADVDIRAMCKARGFPKDAVSSRGILETLFLSSQGLSDVFVSLDARELFLLHLLGRQDTPVNVEFFSRVYGGKTSRGTFTQRLGNCFTKVRQRLVRRGVLLMAEVSQHSRDKKSQMERRRFALPAEFRNHLPPLIPSPRKFDGDGKWKANFVREKLIADTDRRRATTENAVFQIKETELQLNGKCFASKDVAMSQRAGWRDAIDSQQKSARKEPHSMTPDEAAECALSELDHGEWANVDQLTELCHVFIGKKVAASVVCEAGWDCGLLAKRQADGVSWYRPAPESPRVPPREYFTPDGKGGWVTIDLTIIPFDVLEQVVAISDQQCGPRKGTLLVAPNFAKLGRADDGLLTTEAVQWLVEKTKPFADAFVKMEARRGKTILHDNLLVARITDLSLTVAIQKALGKNLVSLKQDFVAFPYESIDTVRRVVRKSGHVVKEVTAK